MGNILYLLSIQLDSVTITSLISTYGMLMNLDGLYLSQVRFSMQNTLNAGLRSACSIPSMLITILAVMVFPTSGSL